MSVDDKYTYPDSGGVLINAAGIRDQRRLDEAMNGVVSITMAEVRAERVLTGPATSTCAASTSACLAIWCLT